MSKRIIHLFFSKFLHESRLYKSFYFSYNRNPNLEQYHVAILTKKSIDNLNYDLPHYANVLPGLAFDFKGFNRSSKIIISIICLFNYLIFSFIYLLFYRPKLVCIHNPELLIFVPIIKFLSLFYKIKICYEPHELEVHKVSIQNRKHFSYIYFLLEFVTTPFCDLVVLVTKPIEDWYKSKYKLDNTLIIPNIPSVDFNHFRASTKQSSESHQEPCPPLDIRSSLGLSKDKIIFLYQGCIDKARGVNQLVEIFSNIKNKKGVLVFMGYGQEVENIIKASDNSNNIYYHPPVDTSILIDFSSSADFGINTVPTNSKLCLSYEFAMGNKFFEYLLSGLQLIVTSNLVYQASTVKEYDLGFVVEPNVKSLSILINNILNNQSQYTHKSNKRINWVKSLSYKKYFNAYADYLDI